ncbi:hypothetical protein ACFRMQ_03660 [Kitasatospora sp. NPDC056783]|uniref:hypothetical protein n=1 Tax=Kitasatospora sp. NPDC056783 TaxID=3345943 RepID=UPI0036BDCA08
MHGSLAAQPLAIGSVQTFVDVWGESEVTETAPRVAVQMTLHLSFAEIMGRLLFSPGALLMQEDLEDGNEEKIVGCLWFAMAQTNLNDAEAYADMAMAVYTGRRESNLRDFAVRLGAAVTRIFGVTVPQPPAPTAAPVLSLVAPAARKAVAA